MLSMKTLRVALLVLVPMLAPALGFAQSQETGSRDYKLDPRSDGERFAAFHYALETMSTQGDRGVPVGAVRYAKLTTPAGETAIEDNGTRGPRVNPNAKDEATIRTTALLEVDGTWYLRVTLDGMAFAGTADDDHVAVYYDEGGTPTVRDPALTGGRTSIAQRVSGGNASDSAVVYRLDVGTPGIGDTIAFDFTDLLAAPRGTAGSYGMSMSVHSNVSDANSGANPVGRVGSATLVRTLAGLNVGIHAFPGIEADVATGFLWFTKPGGGNRAQVDLGYAMVGVNEGNRSEDLLNALYGSELKPGQLLTSPITMTVSGDLSIGAFSIESPVGMRDDDDAGTPVPCTDMGNNEDAPNGGDLRDADGMLITASGVTDVGSMGGLAAGGEHHLCVDVDMNGPQSNSQPIPRGEYIATLSALTPADLDDPEVLGEGVIGRIGRNGASVNIAYLTTSDKHNQRLIVVNRGSSPINVSDVVFQTEDGTDVEMTALAEQALEAMLGPGESVTMRVGDMLNITGDSRRTAATLSFRGVKDNISVATTQVNREDSSTDTVMWPVE